MRILLIISVAAAVLAVGDCLRCYRCVACVDPFDAKFSRTVNCTFENTVCVKSIIEYKSGYELFIRDCLENLVVADYDDGVNSAHIYSCNDDLCNSSPFSSASALLATVGVTILKVLL